MKEKVQTFGRFLSGMVMPNIGAFIAWGLITAFFIETGWLPNATFAALVGPMITYLLPLLIGFTGGKMVHDFRGGVIGAIVTMGVIVGSGTIMFMGAMICGPLAAWILKKFDERVEGKVKPGFEMLVNNFSIGIIGLILTLLAMLAIAPVVVAVNNALAAGVGFFVERSMLPLASLFIEPAKILFLNNAINHGIFSPLGIAQVEEVGKSIFFLLEANPGPGLGILMAYMIAGKGMSKASAPGAIIIHFLGGIHEIYFPFVLMNPLLIFAAIGGGAAGVFTFQMLNVGLTAPASPGSIFALLMMCSKDSYVGLVLGVAAAALVALAIALPILKFSNKETSLEEAKQKNKELKGANPAQDTKAITGKISKIAFACDAGMGSSAMGATVLKNKIKDAGLTGIEVIHTSVSTIPGDVQVVVTHESLAQRAANSNPDAKLVLITNFLQAPEYDELVEFLKENHKN
ncbi:MAG: PTS mannitol transporter subunit IICB [Erysipelotrichaceae bacterium]|nr:PTS mannitol transporter subunit IICB [Erysipelotrichaceae bacterium]MDD3809516.1 PTS mannitol transporter subunit IICB [Erysipelotrichaceae bacterium]